MFAIEYILTGVAVLLLLSILASKASGRLGVPALLLFLAVGMLAGSEGPGGIPFDDAYAAQFLGVVALVFILFAGGLDTAWEDVRPVFGKAVALSTVGVLVTAALVGLFAWGVLGFSPLAGLLLGAIVSSTDAAAVFAVLRARSVGLKGEIKPLLELESGSNDPMAVFLTAGLTGLLVNQNSSVIGLIPMFFQQMALGTALGYGLGRGMVFVINRMRLEYEGLYPVFTLALVVLTYGATASLGGNGFLAVYIAGLVMGNNDFIHKQSLIRFHDGLAWLMQIAMFLTLGLLVFPSRLVPIVGVGLLVALFLMFVA
nr:potassium/proton antiporter [Pyrinomonadaceae bacterium]